MPVRTASVRFANVSTIEPGEIAFGDTLSVLGAPEWLKYVRAQYRGQSVAVKLLADNASPEHEKLFVRELAVLAAVKCSYVPLVFGANIRTKPWCLVLERPSTTASLLETLTKGRLKFDWKVALEVALGLCTALHALHAWQPAVCHGRLTPSCVLVERGCTT